MEDPCNNEIIAVFFFFYVHVLLTYGFEIQKPPITARRARTTWRKHLVNKTNCDNCFSGKEDGLLFFLKDATVMPPCDWSGHTINICQCILLIIFIINILFPYYQNDYHFLNSTQYLNILKFSTGGLFVLKCAVCQ